jgi:hypothetical protein
MVARAALRFLGSALTVLALHACGSSKTRAVGDAQDRPDPLSDAGAVYQLDGAPYDDPQSVARCSADRRSVLDATGNTLQRCAPDEGCAAGRCAQACSAAELNHDNVGCDFLLAPPPYHGATGTPCWAVFVTNNWDMPARIDVTYDGMAYDVARYGRIATQGAAESSWPEIPATGIPPEQVAVLFLSHAAAATPAMDLACPIPAAIERDTSFKGSGRGRAWRIKASVPVSAYDIVPYGGAASTLPSASLLLPTTAWGTNYMAVVPPQGNPQRSPGPGPQWVQILATVDDTHVQIAPTSDLPAGLDVVAAPRGQVTTYTLNAGDFIEWKNLYTAGENGRVAGADPLEASGSILSSDQPIGLYAGNAFLCLTSATSTGGGCESEHEQIPPVSALGSEYVAAPYATRRADAMVESIPYRILGAVSGTVLTYDPAVSGAPQTLKAGQWADFETSTAFAVTSQDDAHPFYLAQMMTGCLVTGGSGDPKDCLGDEDFTNVMPTSQFLYSYVFFTDVTYATTTLSFVRSKGNNGFRDVELDCVGTLSGWLPVGVRGLHEWTSVELMRNGTRVGNCQNGAHSARSTGQFELTVWGQDYAASYAYPAGTNVTPINGVVISPVLL